MSWHEKEFLKAGIKIVDVAKAATMVGKRIGYQGKGNREANPSILLQ
jgi:hypothetical protein